MHIIFVVVVVVFSSLFERTYFDIQDLEWNQPTQQILEVTSMESM